MKSVAVFCGSSKGNHPSYEQLANDLGAILAQRSITLVYGAGNIGLMGAVADGALKNGGHVIGSIPHFIKEKEVCHTGLSELFCCRYHARAQANYGGKIRGFLLSFLEDLALWMSYLKSLPGSNSNFTPSLSAS